MAKMRSAVIALTLLAVVAASAIVFVILLVVVRLRASSGAGASARGISAMYGGITWLELWVVAGGGLALLFALGACVALLLTKRDSAG